MEGPKFVEKMESHKASWVVMDPSGFKVDVEAINKDEATVQGWVDKLAYQRVVIPENFRVVEQKNLRYVASSASRGQIDCKSDAIA
jgi:hypothetical protein